jgi:hypothetical protein
MPVAAVGLLVDIEALRHQDVEMRDVSRHKSMDVLQTYVRAAELFRDHAGAGLL